MLECFQMRIFNNVSPNNSAIFQKELTMSTKNRLFFDTSTIELARMFWYWTSELLEKGNVSMNLLIQLLECLCEMKCITYILRAEVPEISLDKK